MAKQSSHKRWKGCPTCKPHKHRGHGDAARTKFSVLRNAGAARPRRFSRNRVEAW